VESLAQAHREVATPRFGSYGVRAGAPQPEVSGSRPSGQNGKTAARLDKIIELAEGLDGLAPAFANIR
jgi:hypothetical protein